MPAAHQHVLTANIPFDPCAQIFLLTFSAGIGRTGTILVIDMLVDIIDAKGRVYVFCSLEY